MFRIQYLCVLLIAASSAQASIMGGNDLIVDLTDTAKAADKVTWSQGLHISAEGLGFDRSPSARKDGWIHTNPVATGLSWRPAVWTNVRLTLTPVLNPIRLADGKAHTPFGGQAFARYSADLKHWSTWQALTRTDEPDSRTFTGAVNVTERARTEYLKLFEDYRKLDVPWGDDQEAVVKWIVDQDTDFFSRQIPFVGYVEFLFEGPFYGGQRIKSINAWVTYGMSGMAVSPRDPEDSKARDMTPWRYQAPATRPRMNDTTPDRSLRELR